MSRLRTCLRPSQYVSRRSDPPLCLHAGAFAKSPTSLSCICTDMPIVSDTVADMSIGLEKTRRGDKVCWRTCSCGLSPHMRLRSQLHVQSQQFGRQARRAPHPSISPERLVQSIGRPCLRSPRGPINWAVRYITLKHDFACLGQSKSQPDTPARSCGHLEGQLVDPMKFTKYFEDQSSFDISVSFDG